MRELAAYLKTRNASQTKLALETATVTSVQKVGMGDRYSTMLWMHIAAHHVVPNVMHVM